MPRVEDVTEFVKQRGIDRKPFGADHEPVSQRTLAVEAESFQRARQLEDSNREARSAEELAGSSREARTADFFARIKSWSGKPSGIARRQRTRAQRTQLRHAAEDGSHRAASGQCRARFQTTCCPSSSGPRRPLARRTGNPVIRFALTSTPCARPAKRASELTRQLLAFSRRQVLAPRLLDLNELIQELQKMLVRLLGANIELVLRCDRKLPPVRVDPCQIDQVIMNLAINARDAMPNGGKLTIETQSVILNDSGEEPRPCAASGPHVMVAVSDTGTGMDRETQARLFEPFFTTKEVGKGTGLGLSTVFGIVKQSGGNICVESELGTGSTSGSICGCRGFPCRPRDHADDAPSRQRDVLLWRQEEGFNHTSSTAALRIRSAACSQCRRGVADLRAAPTRHSYFAGRNADASMSGRQLPNAC